MTTDMTTETTTRTTEEREMDAPRSQADRNRPGVVVGVDGSRLALDAVRWAVTEARLRRAPLHILHGAPYAAGSTVGTRRARDILGRAYTVAYRIDPTLRISTEHTERPATPSLLDAAQHAQLLVVGMGGGERPQEVLVHSVALEVSGRSPCPVAVVRGRYHSPARAPVLVGVDDPATDTAALNVAFQDAQTHRGRVVVLHAGDDNPLVGGVAALEQWTSRFPDVPVEVKVVQESPVPALLAAAVQARLVVVGSRGRRAPARALFGSTSRAVVRRSPVPVIVVNPQAARTLAQPATAPTASVAASPSAQ